MGRGVVVSEACCCDVGEEGVVVGVDGGYLWWLLVFGFDSCDFCLEGGDFEVLLGACVPCVFEVDEDVGELEVCSGDLGDEGGVLAFERANEKGVRG